MISFWRPSVIAARIRAASASSASSQLIRAHRPSPRRPARFVGYYQAMSTGSATTLATAGRTVAAGR